MVPIPRKEGPGGKLALRLTTAIDLLHTSNLRDLLISSSFGVGMMLSDRPTFACRLALPMAWESLDREPPAADREATAWSNAGIVHFLLHEIDLNASLRAPEERLAEALAPIHTKLEMIIEVLGRLAYRDLALPPPREIELSADRIAWRATSPLPVGGWLGIKLYFHATFLEPIVLYARVAFCGGPEDDGGCAVQAELDEMTEATSEAFARLAFLAQRRQRAERPPATTAKAMT